MIAGNKNLTLTLQKKLKPKTLRPQPVQETEEYNQRTQQQLHRRIQDKNSRTVQQNNQH
jgi:hypothetical protein